MINSKLSLLDKVDIKDDLIVVDPCHSDYLEYGQVLQNTKTGSWVCGYEFIGVRPIALILFHNTCYKSNNPLSWELINDNIIVDSGMICIYPESKYILEISTNSIYESCCDILEDNEFGILNNTGVVCTSGYGDGTYSCYVAYNHSHEIVAIKVVFESENKLEEELMENDI